MLTEWGMLSQRPEVVTLMLDRLVPDRRNLTLLPQYFHCPPVDLNRLRAGAVVRSNLFHRASGTGNGIVNLIVAYAIQFVLGEIVQYETVYIDARA